jgi:hypothetical protein
MFYADLFRQASTLIRSLGVTSFDKMNSKDPQKIRELIEETDNLRRILQHMLFEAMKERKIGADVREDEATETHALNV